MDSTKEKDMPKHAILTISSAMFVLLALSLAFAFLPASAEPASAQTAIGQLRWANRADTQNLQDTGFLFLPFRATKGDWLTLMQSAFDHHYPDYTCSLGPGRTGTTGKFNCQTVGMEIALWEGEVARPIASTTGSQICYSPAQTLEELKRGANLCGYLSGYEGVTGESRIYYDGHDGYDWAIPGANVPILAAAEGRVTNVWDDGEYGWTVEIDHLNGYATRYSHLVPESQNPTKGMFVRAGEQIGVQGCTGRCEGPHLHFRVFHNGNITDPFGWCASCISTKPPDPLVRFNGESSKNLWYGMNPRSFGDAPTRDGIGLIWDAFVTSYKGGPGLYAPDTGAVTPSPTPDLAATLDARVNATLTALANAASPSATPDLDATVEARVKATLSATPKLTESVPNPTAVTQTRMPAGALIQRWEQVSGSGTLPFGIGGHGTIWEFFEDGTLLTGELTGEYTLPSNNRIKIEWASGFGPVVGGVYELAHVSDQLTLRDSATSFVIMLKHYREFPASAQTVAGAWVKGPRDESKCFRAFDDYSSPYELNLGAGGDITVGISQFFGGFSLNGSYSFDGDRIRIFAAGTKTSTGLFGGTTTEQLQGEVDCAVTLSHSRLLFTDEQGKSTLFVRLDEPSVEATAIARAQAAATRYAEQARYATFSRVFMLGPEEGWVVGHDVEGPNAVILHYQAGRWNPLPAPSGMWLFDVYMLSESDGWAVGARHSGDTLGEGVILHFDGKGWTEVDSDAKETLIAIAMNSPGEGWAVGSNGQVLRYDGSAWTPVDSTTMQTLNDLTMVSANEGWAVGEKGTILHLRDGEWSVTPSPVDTDLNGIFMVSSSDGWIVGDDGVVLRFRDGQWTQEPRFVTTQLLGIFMISPDEGWTVGSEGIAHYRDGTWEHQPVSGPTVFGVPMSDNGFYWSVFASSTSDAWAVGWNGAMAHYENGEWKRYEW
jgi:photosystem II stability/assembly factor-like uncharacterized protein